MSQQDRTSNIVINHQDLKQVVDWLFVPALFAASRRAAMQAGSLACSPPSSGLCRRTLTPFLQPFLRGWENPVVTMRFQRKIGDGSMTKKGEQMWYQPRQNR
jgi:hypothetical protein